MTTAKSTSEKSEQPTAIQLLAKELMDEFGPMLMDYIREHGSGAKSNELLSVRQIAMELRVRPTTVRALINSNRLRRIPEMREMRVSRRELERYTSGGPR